MDFGKAESLDQVDFSLPPDHKKTQGVLQQFKTKTAKPQVFVGCAKWGRKEWVGRIYPEGTKDKEFLQNYVDHFNAIELNATHYRLQKSEVIQGWKEKAKPGFHFCPKFHQKITHIHRLKEAEDWTDAFLNSVGGLGENLGVCFLQLPPNYTAKYLDRLQGYLEHLPKEIPVSVELRHPGWFEDPVVFDETFDMLEGQGIGAVITDTAGRRDCVHQRLTSPYAFIRFVGNNLDPTDYRRMDEWVARIKVWFEQGLQRVYFFMHQPDELNSPEAAAYVINKFENTLGIEIPKPQFIS